MSSGLVGSLVAAYLAEQNSADNDGALLRFVHLDCGSLLAAAVWQQDAASAHVAKQRCGGWRLAR
jgi:hypothetical protein